MYLKRFKQNILVLIRILTKFSCTVSVPNREFDVSSLNTDFDNYYANETYTRYIVEVNIN